MEKVNELGLCDNYRVLIVNCYFNGVQAFYNFEKLATSSALAMLDESNQTTVIIKIWRQKCPGRVLVFNICVMMVK